VDGIMVRGEAWIRVNATDQQQCKDERARLNTRNAEDHPREAGQPAEETRHKPADWGRRHGEKGERVVGLDIGLCWLPFAQTRTG
jgi:hypothetical protein